MDLNLLIALDALLEENSVLAASHRLHLTPPAVSRTLSRLRESTGDEILVRSGRAMVPTPYALAIRDDVRELVRQARAMLKPPREIDPSRLRRDFTLRAHDALIAALAPPLIRAVAEAAPLVRLRFLGEGPDDAPDLARGQVDIELGSTTPRTPEISHELLGTDHLALAVAPGHPLAGGRVTARRLAQALHVDVSRRGRLQGALDELLARHGLERRVVAALPTAASALEVVAQGATVALVPAMACRAQAQALGLRLRALPIELPGSPIVMSWHRRHDRDAAHVWLRERLAAAARALQAGSRTTKRAAPA